MLLEILLPEYRDIRLNDTEQAADDRRNPIKVSWPEYTAKFRSEHRHGYRRCIIDPERVHRLYIGYEQQVGFDLFEAPLVTLERTWVLVEVITLAKLRRIDKNRHDNTLGMITRQRDQAEMTVMQVAHSRHKCNMLVTVSPVDELLSQGFTGTDY